ncbi:MAG: PAS domain S-box protein [Paludibacter sp.]
MEYKLNKLLTHQIKKHFGSTDHLPEDIKLLLKDINDTYNDFDIDVQLSRNSIEISSKELHEASQIHTLDTENQQETIAKIKEAIAALNSTDQKLPTESETNDSDSTNLFNSLIRLIEERNQATEALKQSESKYSEVVENVKEIIFQTDTNGLWLFLNKAWEEITGFSVDESLGQVFLNYVHPDDRQRNMELFEPLINRKKDYCRHQIRYLTKDGGFRWIEVFARLGLNDRDEITGTYGTLQDITESKQAEEALQQSNKKWEAIISASPDGIGIASLDGKLQHKSEKLAAMYGYSSDEKNVMYGTDFFDFIDPSNHDLLQDNIRKMLLGERKEKITEYLAIRKDKSRFYVDINSTVLRDADGNPESILFIERDITERKQVEEALQTKTSLLEAQTNATIDAILIIDVNQKRVLINQRAIQLFDIPPYILEDEDDTLLLKHVVELTKYPDKFLEKVMYLYDHPTETSSDEIEFKSGIILDRYSAPVMGQNGENFGRIWTFRDITERKQMETEMEILLDRFKKISSRVPGVLYQYLLRPDGSSCFPFASEAISSIYRVSPEEVREDASKVFSRIHPDDYDGVLASIQESAKNLTPWQHEYRVKFEDETILYLFGNALPQLEEDGSILWHGFITDISERKQAQEKLITSEQNFRTFFGSIADLLFVLDGNGNMIDVNETVIKRLEYSKEELLGQSVLIVHPEARREEAGNIVGEMIAGTKDFCPVPVISKSGVEIQVETRVYPGVWDGEPALFGVVKDVTRIKQSEEKFSKAFQSGSNLMAISTINTGLYIDVNDMFLRVLGFSREEVIGKTSKELQLFEDMKQRELVKSTIDENGFAKGVEVKVRTKSGEDLFGLFSATYIHIGEEPCWLTTMTDITQRKQAEEALQQSENLRRSVMDTTTDLIFVKDRECRFVYINPAGCKLIGKSQEELIGYSDAERMTDKQAAEQLILNDLRIIEGGNTETFEEEIIGADGKLYTFLTTKAPRFDGQGNIIGLIGVAHNITERKQAEKELHWSEMLLRSIMDTTSDVIFVKDRECRFVYINPAGCKLNGKTQEQLIGHSKADFMTNLAELSKFMADDMRIIEGGNKETFEEEIIGADGKLYTFHTTKVPRYDGQGNIIGLIGVAHNITERKLAEAELEESREKYRGLSEASFEAIFISEKGICIEQNQAGEKMFGYTNEEALTRYGTDWIVPEDREMVMNNMISGTEEPYEATALRKDGSTFPCILRGRMTYYKGKNVRVTSLTDITARKKAEAEVKQVSARLSLATQAGGVGVWDYDLVNNSLFWDEQMFSLYGIQKENFSGAYETWKAGLHPDDVVRGDAEIQMAIGGEKEFDTEFRVVWPDGSIHSIRALAIVQRDVDGQALRMIGTNWDITEKKLNEEKLTKAVEAADAANKAKSEFLANMSHEIRTPLNGVIGFTDLLRSTPLSKVQEQYVKNANASGYDLLRIINDILDFSKIEAGMLELDNTETDMIELLGHSVDIIKYAAEKKQLELLLDIDPNMPRFATVDAVRLKQIFANLMGNAIKFTEKGEIELKVSYTDLGNKQGRFSFSVRDTGIGITEEQEKKLFKVFSQADSSTTRRFGGTGLGLVISDMIARKMGSKINIKSQYAKGTTFYFDIETDVAQGELIDKTAIRAIKRSLVIDDNINNRVILEHTLANWGIECVSCDNGLDALRVLETSGPFDVIICDYNMPYINGLETIKLIREKFNFSADKQQIILLHSSSDDAELQHKCVELGVHFRLTKPVKTDELYDYLCQSLEPDRNNKMIDKQDLETQEKNKVPTILIAEDNDFNLILIKAMVLRILPTARIIEVVNGKEAVMFCRKEQPDLILMDIQMPVMNGLEATETIRELEKDSANHTSIVALTAGALKGEQEKCLHAGMDDYLTKPIDNHLFNKMILKYVSN